MLFGLKCGPVDMQPLVVSPNSCTCKPCFPGARPVMEPTIFVGPSPFCDNLSTPETPAVPVSTHTAVYE